MSVLEISKVVCFPSKFDTGASVGFGMITFSDVLTIKFNVVKARSGDLFVGWPQRKKSDSEEYNSLVTFDDKDAREDIQKVILQEFNKTLSITEKSTEKTTSSIVPTEDKPAAKTGGASLKWGGRKQ